MPSYSALLIGLSEPGLELGPLLTSELNLAAEVIREDDLSRVREVDRRATALDATQLDHAHFAPPHCPNTWRAEPRKKNTNSFFKRNFTPAKSEMQ